MIKRVRLSLNALKLISKVRDEDIFSLCGGLIRVLLSMTDGSK